MQKGGYLRAVPVVEGEGEGSEGGRGSDEEGVPGCRTGGRVIGSLSVSDLRGMNAEMLSKLSTVTVSALDYCNTEGALRIRFLDIRYSTFFNDFQSKFSFASGANRPGYKVFLDITFQNPGTRKTL